MADEDEIDVLGDFTLDNLLSQNYENSSLVSQSSHDLICDCSSHWLLDSATSTNSTCWYNNDRSDLNNDLVNQTQSSSETNNQILTENIICDESGWTKKERNLLERAIEIFGRSSIHLAQFIGTKTASEVKYYLKNYYTGVQTGVSVSEEEILNGDVIEEQVIMSSNTKSNAEKQSTLEKKLPKNMKEVIHTISTAKPTVNSVKIFKKMDNSINSFEINCKDIPKGHSVLKSNVFKSNIYNEMCTYNKELPKVSKKTKEEKIKFKIRTKMKVSKNNVLKKKKQRKPLNTTNEQEAVDSNFNSEEVVKLHKNSESNSESDLEIDIENTSDDDLRSVDLTSASANKYVTNNTDVGKIILNKEISWSKEVINQLKSMESPTVELKLLPTVITELEKCFNSEFFENKPTKTPARYLKIRNYILNTWLISKPLYVSKTSIRPGLRNCGDVNSIGRVHQLLEQIGAINFGCVQTTYIRPLYDALMVNSITIPSKETIKVKALEPLRPLNRPRIKKKFTNDGEGGCTLIHNENGDVINTTVVNEEPIAKRQYIKKPTVRLIYCKPFTEDNPQEYDVHLHLSTLLLLDFHAHTSHSEVMGLIGGYWNAAGKTLTISCYVPCKNVVLSSTHCDMCPISQAKAADIIHSEGLNILGWFHSHPTFAPEPSQQDLDTQLSVQQWIGTNNPCIGLILSPFSAHGALIASPYRCLIVRKKTNFEDQYIPYKFKVELVSSNLELNQLLSEAWQIYNTLLDNPANDKINFKDTYFLDQSITYFDKFMSSIKMHLAKCSDINKMVYDAIMEGFVNICK